MEKKRIILKTLQDLNPNLWVDNGGNPLSNSRPQGG